MKLLLASGIKLILKATPPKALHYQIIRQFQETQTVLSASSESLRKCSYGNQEVVPTDSLLSERPWNGLRVSIISE